MNRYWRFLWPFWTYGIRKICSILRTCRGIRLSWGIRLSSWCSSIFEFEYILISSPSILFFDICEISITADFLQGTLVPNTYRDRRIRNSSQHKPQKTYYTNQVPNTNRIWRITKHPVPNLFYELKYDFPVYEQFFYDALVHTMLPCTIYCHTIFSAPTNFNYE